MKRIRRADYDHQLLRSTRTGETYSLSAVLSHTLESKDFFIRHEIIPPNTRSSGPHFHERTDEIVYILKGNPVANEDGQETELSPGDCVCFEANSGLPHFLFNPHESDAEALVISKNQNTPDVCYKPH